MYGWSGSILRVDLTKGKSSLERLDEEMALKFLGGRGFAAKILWDDLAPGIDPLSPENELVLAVGPLTGLPIPSSGKLVVAAKSPLTSGYGDGSIGTMASVQMRRAGLDAIIISGRAERPSYLLVRDGGAEALSAEDLWGLGTFEAERRLRERYGGDSGILTIGPAGENLVAYAIIASQEGRSGGRAGMGAVMGSKNLKAVVIKGSKEVPLADPKGLKELGGQAYREILEKPNYGFWKRQGTMATLAWSQANGVLPTMNFKEGAFDGADGINGDAMEAIKVSQRGCPHCNMTCGNVVEDSEGQLSELDYENVAMLGSDIGIGDLRRVAALNRLADYYGVDTISLGNAIGFAMECSERGLIGQRIEWGDFDDARALAEDIVHRRGLGDLLARGVKSAAEAIGGGSENWAMHVKGLEISAYDCHSMPGMALAYGTSPIGAHHKDAWVISWEAASGLRGYEEKKVDKVIELQRLRGGLFECLTTCRLPWVEVGFDLAWYPKFLEAATGVRMGFEELHRIADRVYALIRAFWVREYGDRWGSHMDTPPARWFEEAPSKGPSKGARLDRAEYAKMLQSYYSKRGWNERGIPRAETLEGLGLGDVAKALEGIGAL
ncbi:MAG: aldehyde ferredoxin oxidoreductase family protein [Candidatus Bathyarchaeia archaeon]